jgi:hypothetical protein
MVRAALVMVRACAVTMGRVLMATTATAGRADR